MSRAWADARPFQDSPSSPTVIAADAFKRSHAAEHDRLAMDTVVPHGGGRARRTPRKSLIVVLPENHVVSPDQVAIHLPPEGDNEEIDVILACAGQPTNIAALRRKVRDLQVLLAPAGTGTEDLRELAMSQAPGDIVTLLCGTVV
jgi:hypothetical protein